MCSSSSATLAATRCARPQHHPSGRLAAQAICKARGLGGKDSKENLRQKLLKNLEVGQGRGPSISA